MQEDPRRGLQGSPGSGHQGALRKTLPSTVKRSGARKRGREEERERERESVSIMNTLLNDLWFPCDIVECFLNTISSILHKRREAFKLLTLSKQLINLKLQPMNHLAP